MRVLPTQRGDRSLSGRKGFSGVNGKWDTDPRKYSAWEGAWTTSTLPNAADHACTVKYTFSKFFAPTIFSINNPPKETVGHSPQTESDDSVGECFDLGKDA